MKTRPNRSLARRAASPGIDTPALVTHAVDTIALALDRRHQREVVRDVDRERGIMHDREMSRRHQTFHRTLELATTLARAGQVEHAVRILETSKGLLLEPPARLPLLTPTAGGAR